MNPPVVVAIRIDDAMARDALALGVELARLRNTSLILAGVWASPLGAGDLMYSDLVRTETERELRAMRKEVPDRIFTRVEVRGSTSIGRALELTVEAHDARTLVLGPNHIHQAGSRVASKLALSVIHDAPCEVAVASRGYSNRYYGSDHHVVVAWDGSAEAREALEVGVELASEADASLRLVHVVETLTGYYTTGLLGPELLEERVALRESHGRRLIAEGIEAVAGRVKVDGELRDGLAEVELADATWNARLVVCGSRAHGTLHRTLMGSTASGLIARADAPVLVVPRGVTAPGEVRTDQTWSTTSS